MRIFFSAILNELKQHRRLWLILFAAHALFLVWKIVEHYACNYYYWRTCDLVFYFILLILCCYIPVVMAPNQLPEYHRPPRPGLLSRIRFSVRQIPHWQLLLLALLSAGLYALWLIIAQINAWWMLNSLAVISYFVLIMLLCIAIFTWWLPRITMFCRLGMLYCAKFIVGLLQLWQLLLLALLSAGLYTLWLAITREFAWWELNRFAVISCFILLMLLCTVAVIRGLPRTMLKPLMPCSPIMLYCAKFIAGLIPFILLTIIGLGSLFEGIEFLVYLEGIALVFGIASGLYAMIFFIAVTMPGTRRPVVLITAFLTSLLLFIMLTPGIMGGIALFSSDAFFRETVQKSVNFSFRGNFQGIVGYFVGFALFFFLVPCIIILPVSGYCLWTKKIMTGGKYYRYLFITAGVLVVSSIALYTIANTDGKARLCQAERDAQSAGLLDKSDQIRLPDLPQLPAEQNAARLYYKAFKTLKEVVYKKRNFLSISTYYIKDRLNSFFSARSSENSQQLTDFFQSPEWKQVYALLEQAAHYPDCRFIPRERQYIDLFSEEMDILADFIRGQAYVYKQTGQENKILPEIEKTLRLAERIYDEQLWDSFTRSVMIIENAMTDAIKIGPNSPAANASYRRMLDYLAQRHINYLHNNIGFEYDYFSQVLNFQRCFEWWMSSLDQAVLLADLFIGYPVVRRYFANYINDGVKVRREMLKIREMPALPPALSKLLNDDSLNTDYDCFLRRSLNLLFKARSSQEMLKIGLALKIYKCEHGKYPASLQELVPAILPSIPVDPLDGRPFGYKVMNGAFFITSELNWLRTLSSESMEK